MCFIDFFGSPKSMDSTVLENQVVLKFVSNKKGFQALNTFCMVCMNSIAFVLLQMIENLIEARKDSLKIGSSP
jgi:hypothetical protein